MFKNNFSAKVDECNVLVSIITVVYNGEEYLAQTMRSVLHQTYQNIEYIIIDGGSNDGTLDIINSFKSEMPSLHLVSEPDKGLYDAMNKGIGLANGELVGMINSDDWYELTAVEVMVNAYLNNPEKSIFHADRFDVSDSGKRSIRKYNPSHFKFKYYGMTYNHPSMFITREEYRLHKYNIDLPSLSDYQFVLEAFFRNIDTFFYVDKALVNYRLDGISAQVSMLESLKQGLVVTKVVGYNFGERLLSVFVRTLMLLGYKNYLRFRNLLESK